MASYNYPQFADKRWKTPVATVAALPVLGSVAGDARIALDTFAVYVFNGTTWTSIAGTGDVVGPASSVNNALVQFSGVTGKLLKNLALGTANQVLGMTNAATDQEYKTLSVGTTGTDFAIAHAANSVAFNLPDASATARGVITTGVQTIAGVKTFLSTITGSISGNAATVTTNANLTGVVTSVGNATSFATSPTFTGTVTIPTPFTIGAVSMTATGTQLNYLNAATGTTGTTSTNVVFSTSPSITTPTFVTNITTPQINAAGAMILATNGSTTALTLGSNQSATFAGTIISTSSNTSVIGNASAVTDPMGLQNKFQVVSTGYTGILVGSYGSASQYPGLSFVKSRGGSIGTAGALLASDNIFEIGGSGSYDGTNFAQSVRILGIANANWTSATAIASKLAFYTTAAGSASPALALTLNSDQSATFGGIVDTGSTGQIKFPATQNASSDANTLDDYEEGTWTPTLTFGGSSSGVTYNLQQGSYVKIGKLVRCNAYIALTNNGSGSGAVLLTGLPFTTENITSQFSSPSCSYYSGMSGLVDGIGSFLGANVTSINLYTGSATTVVTLTDTNFTNTGEISMEIIYRTA